jgi:hypothetical protein
LIYVYAVLAAEQAAGVLDRGEVRGIGGASVSRLAAGDLAAAISLVPAAEFDEEPLNRLMRDLAWLGPQAAAHQAVNARLFAGADAILPLAFGAIFRSPDRVVQVLRRRRGELLARLEAVRGREEWVASLRCVEAQALAAAAAQSEAVWRLEAERAASPPGRAYLLARRLADLRREEVRRLEAEAVEAFSALAGRVAERVHAEPVAAEAALAGGSGRVVARLSLLVPRSDGGALQAGFEPFTREWGPRGFAVELTGPWPPYRFGGLQLAAVEQGQPARAGAR